MAAAQLAMRTPEPAHPVASDEPSDRLQINGLMNQIDWLTDVRRIMGVKYFRDGGVSRFAVGAMAAKEELKSEPLSPLKKFEKIVPLSFTTASKFPSALSRIFFLQASRGRSKLTMLASSKVVNKI